MFRPTIKSSHRTGTALAAVVVLALVPAVGASAATTIAGPIGLGTASTVGVLAATTVTNTGPTSVVGDLGLSPGTSVTGFSVGAGVVSGTQYVADAVALQAQKDLTTAYNVAASLTPQESNLTELSGLSLTPGVYSGGELSLGGPVPLRLAGDAESVWVFQAASTLVTSSLSSMEITGGASGCNVFWQVGSSATLAGVTTTNGAPASFFGTVMANESVTLTTGASVSGRLLARTGAVTLDTNIITAPEGCAPGTTAVATTPDVTEAAAGTVITSAAPGNGAVGSPYSQDVSASGGTATTYAVTSGSLPPGLTLDSATGAITGTPTRAGSYTFSITASDGVNPPATATYTIVIARALAATGADLVPLLVTGASVAALGTLLFAYGRRRRGVHAA